MAQVPLPLHVSFLHIDGLRLDSEAHSSTATVLRHLAPAIGVGSVLLFDEFLFDERCGHTCREDRHAAAEARPELCGECGKAWAEFCAEYGVRYEWMAARGRRHAEETEEEEEEELRRSEEKEGGAVSEEGDEAACEPEGRTRPRPRALHVTAIATPHAATLAPAAGSSSSALAQALDGLLPKTMASGSAPAPFSGRRGRKRVEAAAAATPEARAVAAELARRKAEHKGDTRCTTTPCTSPSVHHHTVRTSPSVHC